MDEIEPEGSGTSVRLASSRPEFNLIHCDQAARRLEDGNEQKPVASGGSNGGQTNASEMQPSVPRIPRAGQPKATKIEILRVVSGLGGGYRDMVSGLGTWLAALP